jgi:hypothetical protein
MEHLYSLLPPISSCRGTWLPDHLAYHIIAGLSLNLTGKHFDCPEAMDRLDLIVAVLKLRKIISKIASIQSIEFSQSFLT